MTTTMKAAVIRAPGDFGIEQVARPSCPAGGLLLKVLACGLCGSDLRTLRSGHHRVKLPWIVGHEIAGVIVETGTAYSGPWQTGSSLAVGPLVYCGICPFCKSGRFELCEAYREIAQHWHGGFAEYIAIPAEAILRGTIAEIPATLDPALATVAEPAASCVHAQEKAQIGLDDTVVIIGAGPVGCIHASLARARGARRVFVVDVNDYRLAQAKEFGAEAVINSNETDPVEAVKKLSGGRGAEVVITANPVPETQVQAIAMACKGGRILLFGGLPPEQSRPGIDTNLIHYNALSVIGTTIFSPKHFETALTLIKSGRIPAEKLVSHRFSLDEFTKGANLALEGKVIKAVFLPGVNNE